MNGYKEERNEKGFTLIELLIAIVVVGILAAVAIVGIGGLTNTGSSSACKASADAAKSASAAFYATWGADSATRDQAPSRNGNNETQKESSYEKLEIEIDDGREKPVRPGVAARRPGRNFASASSARPTVDDHRRRRHGG
jgi:prepilin-type N-terminal cleavage/methylation domain-containing protein